MLSRIEKLLYAKDAKALDSLLSTLPYETIAQVNSINQDSLLHLATKQNDIDILQVALKYLKKEEINKVNGQQIAPVGFAVLQNNQELMSILLEAGADLNQAIQGPTGTLLHLYMNATQKLDIEMVKILINNIKDFDINQKNGFGQTIFDYVCSRKPKGAFDNIEVVKLLLAHDANPLIQRSEFENKDSLYFIAIADNLEVFKYIVKNYNVNLEKKYNINGMTPIEKGEYKYNLAHIAYNNNSYEVLKFLMAMPEFNNKKTIDELMKLTKIRTQKNCHEFLLQIKEKIYLEDSFVNQKVLNEEKNQKGLKSQKI